MTKRNWIVSLAVLIVVAGPVVAGLPPINLEWRPLTQTVNVGDTVGIGLYAVCDPGQTQLFRAADVVFTWDSGYLQLLGVNNTGAVPLLSSTLPANDPYNLNGPTPPPTDGDGYYLAWAFLGQPVQVDDQGALLTTFEFLALAETPQTIVSVATSGGNPVLYSRVFGGQEAGTIVTGTLGAATVTIVPEPATVVFLLAPVVWLRRRS